MRINFYCKDKAVVLQEKNPKVTGAHVYFRNLTVNNLIN